MKGLALDGASWPSGARCASQPDGPGSGEEVSIGLLDDAWGKRECSLFASAKVGVMRDDIVDFLLALARGCGEVYRTALVQ